MLNNFFRNKAVRKTKRKCIITSDVKVVITDFEKRITEEERERIEEIVKKSVSEDVPEEIIIKRIRREMRALPWEKVSYALVCNEVQILI